MSLFASFLLDSVAPPTASCSFTNRNNSSDDGTPSEVAPSDSSAVSSEAESDASTSFSAGMLASAAPSNDTINTASEEDEDEESSYAGQTILSSAPSDTILNIDRLGQTDPNPFPTVARAQNPLSVSTTPSCYLELDDDNNDSERQQRIGGIPRHDSFASLSFHASGMDYSSMMSISSEAESNLQQQQIIDQQQERLNQITNTASFPSLEYHSALPLQSTTILMPHRTNSSGGSTVNSRRLQKWYAQFKEKDWDNLRQRAQMAVKALNMATTSPLYPPPPQQQLLIRPFQLPPSPPSIPIPEGEGGTLIQVDDPTLSLQEIGIPACLPNCFVCPICRSVIVGALTLDCDCGTTVCSACWEYRIATATAATATAGGRGGGGGGEGEDDTFALARGLDYEIVVLPRHRGGVVETKCPCCLEGVHNPIPCHALDVAILQLVQGLDSSRFAKFQQLYYERLRLWREEVIRRQQEMPSATSTDGDGACLSDEMIAGLIQEEEKLWKQAASKQARKNSISIPGAIGFFVAIVASVGIRVLTQRGRLDGRFIRQITRGGGAGGGSN